MAVQPRSIAEALEWFRKRFRAEASRDLFIVYVFELSGSRGGLLSLQIDDGRLEGLPAGLSNADVVFSLSASEFFSILAGSANPDLLFMAERIQIQGDLSLALKLRSLFSTPA